MMVEGLGAEQRRKFDDQLFGLNTGDPDKVDQGVVDEEMKLFAQARGQAQ